VNARTVQVALDRPDPNTLQASFTIGNDAFDVWFRASVPVFGERADAVVPLGLLGAMHAGVPLAVPTPVSPVLLANAPQAQDILAAFSNHELTPTPIIAEPAKEVGTRATGVGAFFSGGVDSFFTALKHDHEISHLVFVRGYDIFDAQSKRGVSALESARRAAGSLGKQLIEVETNLRVVTEPFAPWSIAHGPALGAVALLLQSQLRRILIPSSYTYRNLFPWGSHPLLDPLWGTESLEVAHDGTEATRTEKALLVAASDAALQELRVCNKQWATYNCGICEKCLRTMMNLRLVGALDRCPTLPHTLDLRRVARLRLSDEHTWAYCRENLALARTQRDWPVVLALAATRRPHPMLAARHRLGDLRRALSPRRRRDGQRFEPVRLTRPT
jgi:hypothetical protein